jgi:hypothetical protein
MRIIAMMEERLKKGGLGLLYYSWEAKANAIAFSFYQLAVLDKSNEIRVSSSIV